MTTLRTLACLMMSALVLAPALALAQGDPSADQGADRMRDTDTAAERVAVRFHHMPEGLVEHGRYLGAEILAVDRTLGFVVVASESAEFRAQARSQAEVKSVEPDPVQNMVAFTPNDPLYSTQYGPQLIGAPAAWDLASAANAPAICIVDTGVRFTHVDLAPRWVGGYDFVHGDADPMDDNGHGTHVAGIASAQTSNGVGVAGISGGPLMGVKVLDAAGNGALSTVASGIRWCVDNGAKVVSLSLGATSGSTVAKDAVDYAWSQGAIVVAAAGNGNGCANCVAYPARYTHAIAVGCVDQTMKTCTFASTGPEIDIAAPGNAIQSTWWTSDTAYIRAGGTSMSTPHVAAAAALVWAAHPEYSNAQVRQALEAQAQDVAAAGKDVQTGFGLVRADLAMSASVPEPVTAGVALSPAAQTKTVAPRGSVTYSFVIQNTGSATDTFAIGLTGLKNGWTATLASASVVLAPGATAPLDLTVTAAAKGSMTITLTATSGADPATKAMATAQSTIAR